VERTYTLYISGLPEIFGEDAAISFVNEKINHIVGIGMDVEYGMVELDYACVDGTEDFVNVDSLIELRRRAAYSALQACSNATKTGWERDFNESPAGDIANYEIVERYCTRLSNPSGYCSVGDLQSAIAYNPDCYYEAHNYCQAVTYVQSAAFSDDTTVSAYAVNPSLSGEVACTTVLVASVAYSDVAIPLLESLWYLILDNLIIVFFSVVIIMFVGFTAILRKKK